MTTHERAFVHAFDRAPDVVESAPGRVNLLGEHTDYNEGFVLPLALPQRTLAAMRRRDDRMVRVRSESLGGNDEHYELGKESRGRGFLDYVQGVTASLASAGHVHGGFDLSIASTVPIGAGLSSSAALMVAVLRALRTAYSLPIDDLAVARCAHRAETEFVGAPVGVMDMMASSLGDERAALFLDTRSLSFERVPLPAEAEIVVIDSGVTHAHASGDYRVRRAECSRAAEMLGVRALRDLGERTSIGRLPSPLPARVRHVLTENERVLEGVTAMKAGDAVRLGQLFWASHASMRDDFAVSTPEIDRLVELAREQPAIYGARLTGGGFGGAIVALARRGEGRRAGLSIVEGYRRMVRREGRVLVPSAVNDETLRGRQ
jgi:galactokinase